MIFYISKLLISGFIQFKGNFYVAKITQKIVTELLQRGSTMLERMVSVCGISQGSEALCALVCRSTFALLVEKYGLMARLVRSRWLDIGQVFFL